MHGRRLGLALAGLGLLGSPTFGLGQSAILLRLVRPALTLEFLARRQEPRLEGAQIGAMCGGPLRRPRQPGAGVERTLLGFGMGVGPILRRLGQAAVGAQPGAIGL